MVNRGPGGPRRPAPPAPSRPSSSSADDGEEKTSALNLAEIDLDAIDAAPAKPTPPARPTPPAPGRPTPPAPARPAPAASADEDDEPEEKTAAFDIEAVQRAMAARNAPPAAPARPAPAPTAPARPAAAVRPPADDDEPEEKTAAIDLEAVQRAMASRNAPPPAKPAPAAPARPAPGRPAPPAPARPAPAPAAGGDDEPEEKTSAISLETVERAMAARPAPAPATGRPAPAPTAPARPMPARPAAAAPAPAPADDDEAEEKTAAFDVEAVQRAMAARNAPAATPARPAPAPAPTPARPAAPAPKPAAVADDEPEEKTAAFDVEAFDKAQKARAAAAAPARPAAPAQDEDGFERTMAVSLDDIAGKGKGGARNDRTQAPDDIPAQKAPPGKKLPEPKTEAPKAAEEDAPPALYVKVGQDVGKSYPVTRPLSLVGRGLDADIVINDQSASRKHFNIVKTQSGWKLVDVGSGNGTKVDGVKVPEIALKHGMIIELGSTKLEWRSGGGANPAAEAPAKASPAAASKPAPARPAPAKEPELAEAPEKTQFADISNMAALELDPGYDKKKAAARKDADAGRPAAPADEPEPEAKSSGAGKKIGIGLAVVALLGGGFVAADKFAGLGIIFPKDKPVEKKPDSDGDAPAGAPGAEKAGDSAKKPAVDEAKEKARKEASEKVEAGRKALEAGKVLAANAAFKEALDLDEEADGATDGADKAFAAVKKLGHAVKLQQALASGDFSKVGAHVAEGLATALPTKEWAEKAGPAVQAAATADLVARAFDLLEGGKAADAKPLAEAALKASPDNEQVKLLKDAVDAAAGPTADLRFVPEGEPKPDDKVAATDMAPAFAAYLAAKKSDDKPILDFHGKIQNAGEASVRDVKKSLAYEQATICAINGLAGADAPIKAAAFDQALPQLFAARICDNMLARKRADVIGAALAGAATSLAKAVAPTAPELAATLLKHALVVKPDLADAKAALDGLAPKATEALDKAKAAKDDPDAALAAGLLAMTLSAPDSATWKDAVALVDGLLPK
jgi:hypothetical protein